MCESVIIIVEFLKYNDDADCIEFEQASVITEHLIHRR